MHPDDLTNINSFALLFILIMGILTVVLPRRLAFVPLLLTACYITFGQIFVIIGLNFTFLRVLIFVGWLRLFLRKELKRIELNPVDKALLLWSAASIFLGTLLEGSLGGFINRLGLAYNALGLYFLFRFFINGFEDIDKILTILAIILVPLAIAMIHEYITGRNLFSVSGGVSEFTMVRDERMRCQGPFRHPILAGTFGATLVPLLFILYFRPHKGHIRAIIGILSALIITVTASSRGPLTALLFGIIGLVMWPMRWKMRYIRWATLLTLLGLHMIMQAPVWFLIARLSNVTGGGGWHRAELIDTAIQHLNEWWLVGTLYTKHWMPHDTLLDTNMIDITNQYILEGVNGGILKMFLFIAIIVVCFKVIGRAMRAKTGELFERKMAIWCLGVSLFSHVVSFISVSYFDQIIVFWYLLLAMIATVSHLHRYSQVEQLWSKNDDGSSTLVKPIL